MERNAERLTYDIEEAGKVLGLGSNASNTNRP